MSYCSVEWLAEKSHAEVQINIHHIYMIDTAIKDVTAKMWAFKLCSGDTWNTHIKRPAVAWSVLLMFTGKAYLRKFSVINAVCDLTRSECFLCFRKDGRPSKI